MTLKSLTPAEIKQLLTAKSVRMGYIAEAMECSPAHVSNIINRKTYSKRVAECVCRAISLPLTDVFGDVKSYFEDTNPRSQTSIEHKNQIVSALRAGQSI